MLYEVIFEVIRLADWPVHRRVAVVVVLIGRQAIVVVVEHLACRDGRPGPRRRNFRLRWRRVGRTKGLISNESKLPTTLCLTRSKALFSLFP